MPTIDLYSMDISAPCRSVILLGKTLGIDFNVHEVNIFKKEQLKPEYVAINPQHTIPTIVDGDFVLWESRAILAYLVETYAKNDTLYPHNLQTRAHVEKVLFFELCTLMKRFGDFASRVFTEHAKPEAQKLAAVHEALEMFEQILEGHFFAASNRLTIADYSLVVSIGTFEAGGIDLKSYNKICQWLQRCRQQIPFYVEVEGPALEKIAKMTKTLLQVSH